VSDSLLKSLHEREFLLVESGIFRNSVDEVGAMPSLQLARYLIDEEFIAGDLDAVPGIEVCKVCQQFGEFVP